VRTSPSPAPVGPAAAVEELSWDAPIAFHAESRAPREDEPARGFLLRLHADPDCPSRLAPGNALVARRYEQAKADALCAECSGPVVATAHSSVVRRLREAERTLRALLAHSGDGPMPREIVHCRALRFEAEQARGVHPDVSDLAHRVADLAGEVAGVLKEALAAYDSGRR
jgi:hypothetical protein